MVRTINGGMAHRVFVALAAAIVAVMLSMSCTGMAHAQNVQVDDPIDVSDCGSAAEQRAMLLKEAYSHFGTSGIYIDQLRYSSANSIEQITGSLRRGDASRGEATNMIVVDGAGSGGHLKVRYPNSGRTSTGEQVDVVFDIDFSLDKTYSVPVMVFTPSSGALHAQIPAPYDSTGLTGNNAPGVSADTTVRVYVHNADGTVTEATGMQFAFMFADLDVRGYTDDAHGPGSGYDNMYSEGVELVANMIGPAYTGAAISQADGHLNTDGEPSEGGDIVVSTLNGNTWIHGTHDCGNMADSGVVLRARSGAHFVWRGHSCGTIIGITLADAIEPVTLDLMAVKAMLGGAPSKAGAFTFQLRQGSTVLGEAKNAADGTVRFEGVEIKMPGTHTFTIRETATSDNRYKLDTHVETVTITAFADSGALKVDSIKYTPENGKFSNWAAPGKITIAKYDEDKGVRSADKGHGNASLVGAEFTVYTDRACTQSTGKKIVIGNDLTGTVRGTDADAKESAAKGLSPLMNPYYIKETKAPTGYELNENVYKVESELL